MELYPTLIRAIAVGTFGVIERIGGGLAPQLINLNIFFWPNSALTVTTSLMAASFIAGFFILPETKNLDMPDVTESESEKNEEIQL